MKTKRIETELSVLLYRRPFFYYSIVFFCEKFYDTTIISIPIFRIVLPHPRFPLCPHTLLLQKGMKGSTCSCFSAKQDTRKQRSRGREREHALPNSENGYFCFNRFLVSPEIDIRLRVYLPESQLDRRRKYEDRRKGKGVGGGSKRNIARWIW
jgi:hypothetical protein